MDEQARVITGKGFIVWLVERGIVPHHTRRVVIDADMTKVLQIYVECVGDERLITLEPPADLRGAPVVRVGREGE